MPEPDPVLLAVDAGNTEIAIGLFEGDRRIETWRVATRAGETSDEWRVKLAGLLDLDGRRPPTWAVLASVVPHLTRTIAEALARVCGGDPLVVSHLTTGPVTLAVDRPEEVGADRIANAAAAWTRYRGPAVVVDLGTATNLDCVDGEGRYVGGVIAPGILVSAEELMRRAARLFRVELEPPSRAVGRTTAECLQSGIVWGAVAQIDGLVARVLAETGSGARVVATGGLAARIGPLCRTVEEVEPHLTLDGLRLIWASERKGR